MRECVSDVQEVYDLGRNFIDHRSSPRLRRKRPRSFLFFTSIGLQINTETAYVACCVDPDLATNELCCVFLMLIVR